MTSQSRQLISTSYFGNVRKGNVPHPVAITVARPRFFPTIAHFSELAPRWSFLTPYKSGKIDWPEYEAEYRRLVLRGLTPRRVYDKIQHAFAPDATLVCYEKPPAHCHRHIVAAWFSEELGVEVPELPYELPRHSRPTCHRVGA